MNSRPLPLPTRLLFTVTMPLLLVLSLRAQITSDNVVGYVNIRATPGYSFLTNPLDSGWGNPITNVIPWAADGTRVWLWNVTNQVFDPPSTYHTNAGWDVQLLLPVGRGFVLHTSRDFTFTTVGNVLQGWLTNFVAGTNKFTLIGSKVPQTGTLTELEFPPSDGDNAYQFPTSLQSFRDAAAYVTDYGWFRPAGTTIVNGPVIGVAESFFVQHPGPDKNWVRNFRVQRPANPLPETSEPTPQIESLTIRSGIVTLKVNKALKRYDVQFSTDRVDWTTIASNQTATTWRGPVPPGNCGFFQVVNP